MSIAEALERQAPVQVTVHLGNASRSAAEELEDASGDLLNSRWTIRRFFVSYCLAPHVESVRFVDQVFVFLNTHKDLSSRAEFMPARNRGMPGRS
jgi:hypothetical protein